MTINEEFLQKIINIQKSSKLDFILCIGQDTFTLKNVLIQKSTTPVNRPTKRGGVYKVGFVTMFFPKNFLDEEQLPIKFTVKVIIKDGEAGVEVKPGTPEFNYPVHMFVKRYKGYLYNVDTGEFDYVKVKPQHIVAEHFSWFRFR